ncbi:hypothetical protein [Thermus caldifontis]|uniref:hypothetical protein n=1 Tax=Thermus caldifontis TaxID=1930763 RepID=UPI000DF176D0|nr:hypothetical protein [Thermus caldifontis]
MKPFHPQGLPILFAGLLLLSACSVTLQVPLPDQSFQAGALPGTQGRILYPQKAVTFAPPLVSPKAVAITGTLEANQSLNATLSFYARLLDPASDPSCLDLNPYGIQAYACPIGPNDEKAGEAQFANAQSAALSLGGKNLTQGIAQGQFWLGLEVQGLPASLVTFTLKNLKAIVTVGL